MLTVSIGIPAHNEEKSITKSLDSILSQKQSGFFLENIYVLCDGCTDQTAAKVKSYSDKESRIICVDDGQRLGKMLRQNMMMEMNSSDVLVFLDADSVFANENGILELVCLFNSPAVGLVTANAMPLPGESWFERTVVVTKDIWYETRKDINGGDCVHNVTGACYAISKKLASGFRFLPNLYGDDHFIYWYNKKSGLSMKFAKNSRVYYRVPTTNADYLKQSNRFLKTNTMSVDVFGEEIKLGYIVPKRNKIKGLLLSFFKHPLLFFPAVVFELQIRQYSKKQSLQTSATWSMVSSTK